MKCFHLPELQPVALYGVLLSSPREVSFNMCVQVWGAFDGRGEAIFRATVEESERIAEEGAFDVTRWARGASRGVCESSHHLSV
jgi:hypothetical protein